MAESFDLLGDPIPTDRGRPGRPRHVVTKRNLLKFNMLRAAGWTFDQIAEALGISRPTLRLHYRRFVAEKTPTAKSAVGGRKPGSGRPRGSRSRERSLMVREMDELLKVLDRVAPLNEGRRRR